MLNAKQRMNLEKMGMKSKARRAASPPLSPFAGGKAPGAPINPADMAKQGMAMPTFKKGGKVKKPKY